MEPLKPLNALGPILGPRNQVHPLVAEAHFFPAKMSPVKVHIDMHDMNQPCAHMHVIADIGPFHRMRHHSPPILLPGSKPLRVVTQPGDRLPAFCCSTGRALLARFSDEEVRARHAAPLDPPSPNAPQNMDELLAALAVVRDKGWSLATDESLPGVESIAVCVEDSEGGESIAICISYSAAMISANEKARIITLLMRAGCELGLKFDDAFWDAPRFAVFAAPSWNEAA